MNDNELTIVMRIKDEATKALRLLRSAIGRTGRAMSGMWTRSVAGAKKLMGSLTSIKSLMLGIGAAGAIGIGADFEHSMASVATLSEKAHANIGELSKGVREIGSATGDGFGSLSSALFDAISGGVKAGESMEFLETASKLAVGGTTTAADAVKGLNSIINNYGLEAGDARDVSDTLFQAMRAGVTTIEKLSGNIGKVAGTARNAGVSIQEMSSAVATLTKSVSTEEAATNFRALLNSIIKGGAPEAKKEMKELGEQYNLAALEAKGLSKFIEDVAKAAGGSTEKIQRLIGESAAFSAFLALAADNGRIFNDTLESMDQRAGATERAFAIMSETLKVNFGRLKNDFSSAIIQIVEKMKPTIMDAVEGLREWARWLGENSSSIAAWATAASKSIGEVVSYITGAVRTTFALFAKSIEIGKFWDTAITFAEVGLRTIVEIFQAGVPLLAQTGVAIGKGVGIGIIRGLIGSTQEELARQISGSGLGSLLKGFLVKSGMGEDTFQRLERIGAEMREIEKVQRRLAEAPRTQQSVLENDLSFAMLSGTNASIRRQAKERADKYNQETERLRREGRDFASEMAALRQELEESGSISGFLSEEADRVREAGAEFTGSLRSIAESGKRDIEAALDPRLLPFFQRMVEAFDIRGAVTRVKEYWSGMKSAVEQETQQEGSLQDAMATMKYLTGLTKSKAVSIATSFAKAVKSAWDQTVGTSGGAQSSAAATAIGDAKDAAADASADVTEVTRTIADLTDAEKKLLILSDVLTNSFTNAFGSIIDGTQSVTQAFGDMTKSIFSELARLALIQGFGALFDGIFDVGAARGILNGKFAMGGPVQHGRAVLVGEQGPEIFVPPSRGSIVPNHQMGATGNRGSRASEPSPPPFVINVSLPVQAMDAADARRGVMKAADQVSEIILQKLATSPAFRYAIGGAQ